MKRQSTITGVIERQAVDLPQVAQQIANMFGHVALSLDYQLTLDQQAPLSGISAANLLRYWKLDPDYYDVIYAVGKTGTDYRTTMRRINTCRDRAAKRASIKPGSRSHPT